MQVASFKKHTVTECEACGLLIAVKNPHDVEKIGEAYQQHLSYYGKCRKYHDDLPSFKDVLGILKPKDT